ncbi:MAG: hypothetical protein QM690_22310, partial [Sphingobium sp.]
MTRIRFPGLAASIALGLLLSACATDRPLETACPALERFTYPRLGEAPAADPAAPPPPAASPPGMARTRRPAVPLPAAANDNEPPGDSMDAV